VKRLHLAELRLRNMTAVGSRNIISNSFDSENSKQRKGMQKHLYFLMSSECVSTLAIDLSITTWSI